MNDSQALLLVECAVLWEVKMTILCSRHHQVDSGSKWCHQCKMATHMSDGLKTNHFYINK